MSDLLDANVLIALTVTDHVHHEPVQRWFDRQGGGFATCPITEGALVRHVLRVGGSVRDAGSVLAAVARHARHEFWADSLNFSAVEMRGVVGHRQVTDAYLAALARANGGRLATLDAGLGALHPDVALMIET